MNDQNIQPQGVPHDPAAQEMAALTRMVRNWAAGASPSTSPFHGREEEDAYEWLEEFEFKSQLYQLDEATKINKFRESLRSNALDWFKVVCKEFDTWADIEDAFHTRYIPGNDKVNILNKLLNTRQGPEEKALDFLFRILLVCRKYDADMTEPMTIDFVTRGLRSEIKKIVIQEGPGSIEDLKELVARVERSFEGTNKGRKETLDQEYSDGRYSSLKADHHPLYEPTYEEYGQCTNQSLVADPSMHLAINQGLDPDVFMVRRRNGDTICPACGLIRRLEDCPQIRNDYMN